MTGEDPDDVPAMSAGDDVFFLAAQSVYRGLKFFDDAAARFEVVSDPVDVDGGRFLATVRHLDGLRAGEELTAQLHTGHRVT